MTSALIFALSMAGFGLLVFGERMGLGTELASLGVAGIFVLAGTALALVSMTSRLNRFVVGADRGAGLVLATIVASLLIFGFDILFKPDMEASRQTDAFGADVFGANAFGPNVFGAGFAFLLGFSAALILTPFNPWRNFGAHAAQRNTTALIDQDPARETCGALPVVAGVMALAAGLIVVRYFPVAIDTLVGVTGWPRAPAFLSALVLIGLPAVLGGLLGLGRTALVLVAIALATIAAPFAVFMLGEFLAQFDAAALNTLLASGSEAARTLATTVQLNAEWPALALGFAAGLVVLQPAAALGSASTRFFAVLAGVAMALIVTLVARSDVSMLREIIANRIAAAPPAQWPVFVFDEALRGWLSTCGVTPEDAQAAAQACGTRNPRAPLPPGAYRFAEGLAAPALALAQGWPIILGFISGLVRPLIALIALGVLLHAAASGVAERLLFRILHPRALRAWRLAMARLALIVLLALILVLERQGFRLDPVLFRWALLGLGLTGFIAMIGYRLILLIRFFRSRRASRASLPEAAPEPG